MLLCQKGRILLSVLRRSSLLSLRMAMFFILLCALCRDGEICPNNIITSSAVAFGTGAGSRVVSKKIIQPFVMEKFVPVLITLLKDFKDESPSRVSGIEDSIDAHRMMTVLCGPHSLNGRYDMSKMACNATNTSACLYRSDCLEDVAEFEDSARLLIPVLVGAMGDAATRVLAEWLFKSAYLAIGGVEASGAGADFLTRTFGLGHAMTGVAVDLYRDVPSVITSDMMPASKALVLGLAVGSLIVGAAQKLIKSALIRRIFTNIAISIIGRGALVAGLSVSATSCGANTAIMFIDILPRIMSLAGIYRPRIRRIKNILFIVHTKTIEFFSKPENLKMLP